ncbi:hypothetical protein VYU27_005717 [Nannochloropsis oceanica]
MESAPPPPPPAIVVRQESVTWPADSPPPNPTNYGSFSFFPPALESSTLLPSSSLPPSSTAAAYIARSPCTDRRLRWRALMMSISMIVGVVAFVLVSVILFTPRGHRRSDENDTGMALDSYPSPFSSHDHEPQHGEDDQPYLLAEKAAEIILGSAGTPTHTTATTSTAAAVADSGSPSYPTSAPDNPNIHIPVTMGCMEAKCEAWMAAMGKNHGDPANLVLLDCIQRTGMSADSAKRCFANSNVTASPVRMGLYRCAVCKACMPPQSKNEKAALCQISPTSSSSTAAPVSSTDITSPPAPSPSDWGRYMPSGYVP